MRPTEKSEAYSALEENCRGTKDLGPAWMKELDASDLRDSQYVYAAMMSSRIAEKRLMFFITPSQTCAAYAGHGGF